MFKLYVLIIPTARHDGRHVHDLLHAVGRPRPRSSFVGVLVRGHDERGVEADRPPVAVALVVDGRLGALGSNHIPHDVAARQQRLALHEGNYERAKVIKLNKSSARVQFGDDAFVTLAFDKLWKQKKTLARSVRLPPSRTLATSMCRARSRALDCGGSYCDADKIALEIKINVN